MDFKPFKQAIATQFARMSAYPLFRTDVSKDWLWQTYLGSFPEGSNPIYKERTEHDCNCCKSFVRAIGNVVAIVDGHIESLWDIQIGGAYQVVADAMAEMVKANPIVNVFLHAEPVAGVDQNFQYDPFQPLTPVATWNHLFVNLPRNCVVAGEDMGPKLSDTRATHDVLLRSLTELTTGAVETVLELIAQNSLYRGAEHKFAIEAFQKLQRAFCALPTTAEGDLFVWTHMDTVPQSVSRIRNTAIGTLLIDLSAGMDMEAAVKAFERVVAPTNYKRPTALVTPQMIEMAKEKIQELGLMSALSRRYATLADITVNNILFADRTSRSRMAGNVFDDLAASLPVKPKTFDKVEEVGIEKFLADILPTATTVEVMFENGHVPNLVSLIAPEDPTAGRLFKWDNPFSWAYNGEVADSIKERVKQQGGTVEGDLCCRLAWDNYDDLDFHMIEPGGYEIMYTNARRRSPCGGVLDVDMNAGCGATRNAVENIFYASRDTMREGVYKLIVNQFQRRETSNVGFQVDLDYLGTVYHFTYGKAMRSGENVLVAEFKYTRAHGIEIINSLPSTQTSQTTWGLATQAFHKVNVLMLSPNHWDGHGVGNKHYLFVLDGCVNEGDARGFFNEFLSPALEPHRKAFELVGAKMRAATSPLQLSGLGFNSTTRNSLICRVTGSFTRTLKVLF